jgi:hypothetical protein
MQDTPTSSVAKWGVVDPVSVIVLEDVCSGLLVVPKETYKILFVFAGIP